MPFQFGTLLQILQEKAPEPGLTLFGMSVIIDDRVPRDGPYLVHPDLVKLAKSLKRAKEL